MKLCRRFSGSVTRLEAEAADLRAKLHAGMLARQEADATQVRDGPQP